MDTPTTVDHHFPFTLWQTNSLLLKIAIEIVDLPIKNCDFSVRYVKLPEGTHS